jgi:hypothetical protein
MTEEEIQATAAKAIRGIFPNATDEEISLLYTICDWASGEIADLYFNDVNDWEDEAEKANDALKPGTVFEVGPAFHVGAKRPPDWACEANTVPKVDAVATLGGAPPPRQAEPQPIATLTLADRPEDESREGMLRLIDAALAVAQAGGRDHFWVYGIKWVAQSPAIFSRMIAVAEYKPSPEDTGRMEVHLSLPDPSERRSKKYYFVIDLGSNVLKPPIDYSPDFDRPEQAILWATEKLKRYEATLPLGQALQ